MIDLARHWLDDQQSQGRELLLVVDRLAEPDPIVELFGADLMQSYINLYQGTEFDAMADVGPWLVHVIHPDAAFFQSLLNNPQRNWGWLASAEHIDLSVLAQHWRERMLIDEQEQRALYRFQDNRVIARHLAELSENQYPLLLGPLNSALCWDGQLGKASITRTQAYTQPPSKSLGRRSPSQSSSLMKSCTITWNNGCGRTTQPQPLSWLKPSP